MIGLADCNNFYCSCERVFRPDLTGKPVVVLSNNDGCVIARSEEAKALGYKMDDPFYQVKENWRLKEWLSSRATIRSTVRSPTA